MKTCRECGTSCTEDTVFCPVCGTKFHIRTSKIDSGYASAYFVSNTDSMEAVLDAPVILITDRVISDIQSILPLLEEVAGKGRHLLIIADSYEEEVIATLIVNKLRGILSCVAIKVPECGNSKKDFLKDLAILTAGKVISSDNRLELKDATISLCGWAKTAIITKEETVIIGGTGNEERIIERISQLKELISRSHSYWDREAIQNRLINLFELSKSELQ